MKRREYHGMTRHPLYSTWWQMVNRCNNPTSDSFAAYGGRGIQVCDRWAESFSAFVEDMGERPPRTTLDRIYNGGNYERSNCRWATQREQNLNQRVRKDSTSGI